MPFGSGLSGSLPALQSHRVLPAVLEHYIIECSPLSHCRGSTLYLRSSDTFTLIYRSGLKRMCFISYFIDPISQYGDLLTSIIMS